MLYVILHIIFVNEYIYFTTNYTWLYMLISKVKLSCFKYKNQFLLRKQILWHSGRFGKNDPDQAKRSPTVECIEIKSARHRLQKCIEIKFLPAGGRAIFNIPTSIRRHVQVTINYQNQSTWHVEI